MAKPTLLYVITQGEPWGGAQEYVYQLALGASSAYHVVVAIGETSGTATILSQKLAAARAQGKDITVVHLKHLRRNLSVHDTPAIVELEELYKRLQAHIIHLNSSKASVLGSVAFFSFKKNVPAARLISTVHGWAHTEPVSPLRRWLYRVSEQYTAPQKDALIVLSKEDQQRGMTDLHIPLSRLPLIRHGVPTHASRLPKDAARAALIERLKTDSLPDSQKVWFGVIANFYRTKGIDILINAIKRLCVLEPGVIVILIGDGPERSRLTRLIYKHHLENNIWCAGFIETAVQLLPAFDTLVIPSRKEGVPFVLLEALVQKIPIIATAVGGIPSYIIPGETGLLVPPNSTTRLRDALMESLQNPQAMQHMAAAAYERFGKDATTERMITETLALYQSL